MNIIQPWQTQQQLLAAIALQTRQFLNLRAIFAYTAQQLQTCLSIDSALFHQVNSSSDINIEFLWNNNHQTLIIHNIYDSQLTDEQIQQLEQYQIKSLLIVPILLENSKNIFESEPLWGRLILHQYSAQRQWEESEVEFCEQVSVQIAIAIQQEELYRSLEKLKAKHNCQRKWH